MSELREALTAAQVAPLIPKVIDRHITNLVKRYSPLTAMLPDTKWNSNVFYFNVRSQLPQGDAVTDGGAVPQSVSVYQQTGTTIKEYQTIGGVTGFAQEVTASQVGSLLADEIAASVQGHVMDLEADMVWGAAASSLNGPAPRMDGLAVQFSQFASSSTTPQNSIDAGGAAFALRNLDELIDAVESNLGAPVTGQEFMFVMSSSAESKIAQLQTAQQRYNDGNVTVDVGLTVPSYRGVPIAKSSYLGSRGFSMSTVAATTATAGGSLAAGTYYYAISPAMSRMGEIAASAAVSVTTTGSTSTVTLSFSPPVGYQAATPRTYYVYRGATASSVSLLGTVDAYVTLASDGITRIQTTSIVDTGSALIPQNGATQPNVLPTQYYNTNPNWLPRQAGTEEIYLLSRSRNNIIRPWIRNAKVKPLYATTSSPDSLPFALMSDTCVAVRNPLVGSRLRNVVVAL